MKAVRTLRALTLSGVALFAVVSLLVGGLLVAASPAAASTFIPPLAITGGTTARDVDPPVISASAGYLIDADTGAALYSKDADEQLPMASTTKIMTATLVLEALDPQQKVTVPRNATGAPGSLAGLVWGEVLTVEELLYALLLPSGNDAAIALADEVAGSVPAFVEKMNEKAETLGLTNTHFANPNGLHLEDHYSSARDLAILAEYAMRNPDFRRIVATPTYELPWPDGENMREYKNGNVLLTEYPWVTGVKTGSTPYAGYCMVASGSKEGVSLIAVILGAEDDDVRWTETRALLDYGMSLYPWVVLVDKGELIAELETRDPLGRTVGLVSERALVMRLSAEEVVTGSARLLGDVPLPVHAGDELGVLDFTLDGAFLDSVRLIAARSINKPSLIEIMRYWRHTWHPSLFPAA